MPAMGIHRRPRPAPGGDPRAGIVLVFVSGILTVFLSVAVLLFHLSRAAGKEGGTRLSASRAALAATSGMEYAAARLGRDSLPGRTASAAARGDDWTYRDPAGIFPEAALNPSYAHGEPWEGGASRYAGAGPFVDVHPDGRFTSSSGRLRGGASRTDLRFLLKVDSPEGRIPLNGGFLRDWLERDLVDNDGDGQIDEPGEGGKARTWIRTNGQKDDADALIDEPTEDIDTVGPLSHSDVALPYHADLVRILNSLRAILLPASTAPLGTHLVSRRPYGGYRAWRDVEQTLLGLGYLPSEIELLHPFLDLETCGAIEETGRCYPKNVSTVWASAPGPCIPINLNVASREVMAAVWMGSSPGSFAYSLKSAADFPKESPGGAIDPHTGTPFGDPVNGSGAVNVTLTIWETEALGLADEVIRLRSESPPLDWKKLRRGFADRASSIFWEDFNALAGTVGYKWGWVQAKASFAFHSTALDPWPSLLCAADWGADLDQNALNGVQAPPIPPVGLYAHGFTVGAPVRFHAVSAGVVPSRGGAVTRSVEGSLGFGERLELSSQEDFENLEGGAFRRAFQGIEAVKDPSYAAAGARHGTGGSLDGPKVVTLPLWNWRGVTSIVKPGFLFSRVSGGVGLAPADPGTGGNARFLFNEDFDGKENGPPAYTSPPFWSEMWAQTSGFSPMPTTLPPPYRANVKWQNSTPYLMGQGPGPGVVLQIPGSYPRLDPATGQVNRTNMRAFSFSMELSPSAIFAWQMSQVSLALKGVRLETSRTWRAPGRTGTLFRLEVEWINLQTTGNNKPRSLSTWFVEDPPAGPRGTRHVLLTLERIGSGTAADPWKTRCHLYVDGSDTADGGATMIHIHDGMNPALNATTTPHGELMPGGYSVITFGGVDDLRIHNGVLAAPSAAGRYRDTGTFESPLYRFDAPVTLARMQWMEAIPRALEPLPNPISVELIGEKVGGGVVTALLLGGGKVHDLAATSLGVPIRSLLYKVHFSCGGISPLLETPQFESIWLTFRRQGGAAGWTSWTSR